MAMEQAQVVDDEIDLRQYLRTLWRRRWVIVGVTALAAAAALLATRAATPIYEATTTVLVRQGQGSAALIPGAAELLGSSRTPVQNYVELLKSRTVMERAVQALGWPEAQEPGGIERLQGAVTVQPVQGTDHIRVKVRLPDPQGARALADALVASFSAFNQEMNRLETRSALEFVESQLGQVRANLQEAENALLRYKQGQRLVEPSQEAKAAIDKLAELEKMQASTAVSLSETATRIQEVERQLKRQQPTLITATTISNNPLLQNYRLRLAELEVQLSGALESLAPNHPQVVALKAEIAEIRRRMNEEVERVISAETQGFNPLYQDLMQQYIGLQASQIALQARQQALGRLIADQEAVLRRLPERELELARLAREQRVNEELYVFLRTRFEELRIQQAMVTADIRTVDPASLPKSPVSPRPLLNMAVALFLGLFLGVGLAFALEFLDTTVKADDDLERVLGVPVLGRIPAFRVGEGRASAEGGR